jgi:DNA-binding transcriptional regulator GbsR (MarR family)
MNNMKSKLKNNQLLSLSLSIGNFIRYWGFRRIHGAIWSQLYLSRTPLSCKDLTEKLALSKALISPALDELCQFKLIKEAPSPNEKTKLYIASENVSEVIHHVLKGREAVMLKKITKDFSSFAEAFRDDENIDKKRVDSLGDMIVAANLMLEILLAQKDILKLPMELDV